MGKIHLILLVFLTSFSVLFAQERGNATYYSKKLQGRHTSDGSRYHPDSLTCAHKYYPLGTYLLVRNPKNNQQVVVKVTDRGPFHSKLMIDLSYSAAKSLDILQQGVAPVEISKYQFIPEVLSLLPTPKAFLGIQQIYMVSNVLTKLFGNDEEKSNQKK